MRIIIIISLIFSFIIKEPTKVGSITINGNNIYVIQQPKGNNLYVPSLDGYVSQFKPAEKYGVLGFLAHSNLSGKEFDKMSIGDSIKINEKEEYTVTDIRMYYSIEPDNPYSDLINLNDPFTILTSAEVFNDIYTIPNRVILQTCMVVGNEDSWGRFFVIAEKEG